jgi:hypothetical protein
VGTDKVTDKSENDTPKVRMTRENMRIDDFHGWVGIYYEIGEIVIDDNQRLAVFNSQEEAEKWLADNTMECAECGEVGVKEYDGGCIHGIYICFSCLYGPMEKEYPDNIKDIV